MNKIKLYLKFSSKITIDLHDFINNFVLINLYQFI